MHQVHACSSSRVVENAVVVMQCNMVFFSFFFAFLHIHMRPHKGCASNHCVTEHLQGQGIPSGWKGREERGLHTQMQVLNSRHPEIILWLNRTKKKVKHARIYVTEPR